MRVAAVRGGRLHPQPRQPRRYDKRNRQREQHAHARVDRDWAHVRPHEARHKRHRKQRCDHRERGQYRWAAHFVDSAGNDLCERLFWEQLLVTVNVFDDDDGVVYQYADRENQRKQRHAIKREAPCPRCEERGGERQNHCRADDRRFASSEREEDEGDDGRRSEQEFRDEFLCLVVGGRAVVARLGDLHVGGNYRVLQRLNAARYRVGDINRVLAGLLRHADRDCRIFRCVFTGNAVPHVAASGHRTVAQVRNVAQEHGFASAHRHDQLTHFSGFFQERARFNRHRVIARDEFADRQAEIGREQSVAQVGHGDADGVHTRRVNLHHHRAAGAADGDDFASAIHALDVCLNAVRDALQIERAGRRVFAEERERDNRNVIDAFRLDDRGEYAEAFRQPIRVRIHRVVQPHERLSAWNAHFELHCDNREARTRDGHHVLNTGNLREHLFGRNRDRLLHFAHRSTGERNQHVRHGHVDLWLFFARRDEHCEHAEQQRHERQERRDLRGLKVRSNAAGDAHRCGVVLAHVETQALAHAHGGLWIGRDFVTCHQAG